MLSRMVRGPSLATAAARLAQPAATLLLGARPVFPAITPYRRTYSNNRNTSNINNNGNSKKQPNKPQFKPQHPNANHSAQPGAQKSQSKPQQPNANHSAQPGAQKAQSKPQQPNANHSAQRGAQKPQSKQPNANQSAQPGAQKPQSKPQQPNANHSAQPADAQKSQSKPQQPNTNHSAQPADAQQSQPKPQQPNAAESDEAVNDSEQSTDPQIPFHKLPDLTRGLPPTFGQETHDQESSGQSLQAVERDLDKSSGPRGKRESYIPSSERNRRWWIRFIMNSAALASILLLYHMGRQWDEEEAARHSDIPNGFSVTLWWKRMRARMKESISYYQDPAFDKLLPDPVPGLARPYTLCLSLDDLLIHSEWTREHGWRVAKRPGLDYFIRYLSQYYELVLFTTVPSMFAEPLLRKMDPFRFIMWPLFREATKFENGEIVKDLSYLNRDLSKVIIIDTNPSHVRKQPENAIILEPWKGDPQDKELVGLIPFLEYMHTVEYSDVRDVLKSFEGKHIPTEFARREAIARREHQKQLEEKRKAHNKNSGLAVLGNLLGLKSNNMSMTAMADGEQSPSEAFAQGKMLQDIVRERGQRSYEAMEKDIRENGERWLKEEQQAMEKAQKEAIEQAQKTAVNSVVGTITSAFKPFSEGSQEEGK